MEIFKCKMCGGTLEFEQGATVGVCDSCGTKQTLPRLDDERRANLYDRANHFRRNNEFDRAEAIYEQILNEDNTDAEAYWSIMLCRYGVEYVEDPATHRRVPTVNRAQFTAVFDDPDYKYALEYADGFQKEIYEEEARAINEIQKGILAISQKEEPFDVFICYKETDNNGRRTSDSVLATELYHQLIQEGIRVFFARITLEDKLGTEYEPYIFAALNSAKVMVVLGTKPEHFHAVWVKNEWSRYLALVKKSGGKKVLIPAYRDMDPYDLPDEFSHLQAQDMSKLGFMQDLIRGITKVLDAGRTISSPEPVKETVVIRSEGGANLIALIKRGNMALEDGEWDRADEFFEQVLNMEAECAEAYAGKLCAKWQCHSLSEIKQVENAGVLRQDKNYQKAMRYGSEALQTEMEEYVAEAEHRQRKKIAVCDLVRVLHWYEKERRLQGKAEILSPIRKRLEPVSTLIVTGRNHTVGLKSNGSVVAVGDNRADQCDVVDWTDIVAVSVGEGCTVGLKSDGTVLAAGDCARKGLKSDGTVLADCYNKEWVYGDVGRWRDIVSVSAGDGNIVGLKSDGTVVAVGYNLYGQCDVGRWRDIVSVSAGDSHTVGLKSDGSVVAVGWHIDHWRDIDRWRDIVSVAKGIHHIVGLKSNGTVLAAGGKGYDEYGECNVGGWTDIVSLAAGDDHTVGLKSNGSVVAVGNNRNGQCNVAGWTDIVSVAASGNHTVGLKSDGSVVAVGDNRDGQCNVVAWRDIVSVAASGNHTVGLKSDGTVVVAGQHQCGSINVGDWKLFSSFDTLEEERRKAVEEQERQHHEEERQRIITGLNAEKSTLHSELANLRGLFTGKRRREIETRLTEIETEFNRHKKKDPIG